jgi:hypothetical protein
VTPLTTIFPPPNADAEDLKVAWREAADDMRLAYRAWCDADRTHAREAYAVFLAASDRETVAADCVRQAARRS